MSFGRQKNLARRAVRPDGRIVRDARRRRIGKATLLDLERGTFLSRFLGRLARILRR